MPVACRVRSGADTPLLECLPCLQEVEIELTGPTVDIYFLGSPPSLRTLKLEKGYRSWTLVESMRIVATIQRCSQLRALRFFSVCITSSQLSLILPSLPHLTELNLAILPALTSPAFLSTDALAASLTMLNLFGCMRVPCSEIEHLMGLASLKTLAIREMKELLTDEQKMLIRAFHPRAELSAVDPSFLWP